jgi:ubiquinone/menaquinone biosynthesis C-methylase UbiE
MEHCVTTYLEKTVWDKVDQSETPDAFVDYLHRLDQRALTTDYRSRFLDAMPVCSADRVLDVGCGIGSDSRLLAKRMSLGSVTGVDFSRHMVRRAKDEASKGLRYAAGDMCCLPFLTDHFDGVFCNRVLMHLDRPFDAIQEMVRVIKPGGWMALWEPAWLESQILPDSIIARDMIEVHSQSFAHGNVGSELADMAQRAGCRIEHAVTQCDTLHDFETAWSMANFERTMHRVVDLGAFTIQDMMQWKEGLAAADGEQKFGMTLCAGVCIVRKV